MTGVMLTGACRGIGAAIAVAGARAGYADAVHCGSHHEESDAICKKLAANGGRAFALSADMGIETDIAQLFKSINREL